MSSADVDSAGYSRLLTPLLAQAGAYARSLLRSTADAEDAVQHAALRGWERIRHYDASRPFGGWWFAILRNCCFDALRAKKSRREAPLDGIEPQAEENNDDFDFARLDAALAQVSESHREILQLKYFGNLKYDDIAEALGIPRGTVMSRLHLARKALASVLREETQ